MLTINTNSVVTGSGWNILPPHHSPGDHIIIAIRVQKGGEDQISHPDFTYLGPTFEPNSTIARRVGFFYKIATDNEPESYGFTASNGGRCAFVSFTINSTDTKPLNLIATSPTYSSATSESFAISSPSLVLTLAANECTNGNPSRPLTTPNHLTEVGFSSTSMESISSRTSIWVGATTASTTVPQADVTWGNSAGSVVQSIALESIPVSTSLGYFGTQPIQSVYYGSKKISSFIFPTSTISTPTPVTNLLNSTETFYISHRLGGANYPEFSVQGLQASLNRNYTNFEISTTRCATGEFICCHDWDTKGATGVSLPIWSASFSDLQALTTLVPQSSNASPAEDAIPSTLQNLTDILALIPEDSVVFIDHKTTSGGFGSADDQANVSVLLDLLDSYPNSTERFIWKSFKGGTVAASFARQRGYKVCGIYYGEEITASPNNIDSFDLLGMAYTDSQEYWDVATSTSKKVIAHIIYTESNRNTALTKGANGIMNSNILAMP